MFSAILTAVLASSAIAAPTPVDKTIPTLVNWIPIKDVAFAKVINSSLYLSAFTGNPFAKNGDKMYYYPDGKVTLRDADHVPAPQEVTGPVTWPNEVAEAPASVFGQAGVIVAGGFLVPGKSNGGLWYSATADGKQQEFVNLFTAKNYFYHRIHMMDVNGDGQTDILSCRATKSMFGAGKGDLVFLEPVDRAQPIGQWKETVIGKHCDTFFEIVDIDGDGKVDIISAEFWGSSLTLIRSTDPNNAFHDASKLVYTTIDNEAGQIFDLQFKDINGDGKKDLLVTNHQGNKAKPAGAVYVYEIPTDVTAKWTRHTIAENFPVLQKGIGQASPGGAQAFHAHKGDTGKPLIVVAGDGSQKAYILTPNSQNPKDWSYTTTVFHDCQSTVGAIGVGDVNADGKTEIYVPCYDKSYLATFTY